MIAKARLQSLDALAWQTIESFDPNVDGEAAYILEAAADNHGAIWLRYSNDKRHPFALPASTVQVLADATSPEGVSIKFDPALDGVLVLRSNGDAEMYRPNGETIVGHAIEEASRHLANFDRSLGIAMQTKKANA